MGKDRPSLYVGIDSGTSVICSWREGCIEDIVDVLKTFTQGAWYIQDWKWRERGRGGISLSSLCFQFQHPMIGGVS